MGQKYKKFLMVQMHGGCSLNTWSKHIGFFSNMDVAIRVAQDINEKYGKWQDKIPIPYTIFIDMINYEDNNTLTERLKRRGFSGKDIKKTIKWYKKYGNCDYNSVTIHECRIVDNPLSFPDKFYKKLIEIHGY